MPWLSRLRNALNPRRLDGDLADEMADHIRRRAAALHEKGRDAEEARRLAQLRFGNTTLLHEASREFRLCAGLEGALQDIRYAWRGMRKAPAFVGTAVISLALTIGANTAIYSIVDAAILRPLPVYKPEQLFLLSWPGITDPGLAPGEERQSFSYPEFLQYSAVIKPEARLALFSSPGHAERNAQTQTPRSKESSKRLSLERRLIFSAFAQRLGDCSQLSRIGYLPDALLLF
jgi:hypothetical protein